MCSSLRDIPHEGAQRAAIDLADRGLWQRTDEMQFLDHRPRADLGSTRDVEDLDVGCVFWLGHDDGDDALSPFTVLDARNADLYARYRKRVRGIPGLFVCGRLGEYRYYDMDQAIGRANVVARRILGS